MIYSLVEAQVRDLRVNRPNGIGHALEELNARIVVAHVTGIGKSLGKVIAHTIDLEFLEPVGVDSINKILCGLCCVVKIISPTVGWMWTISVIPRIVTRGLVTGLIPIHLS